MTALDRLLLRLVAILAVVAFVPFLILDGLAMRRGGR